MIATARSGQPCLGLFADDLHQIAHRVVDIHQMQSPVRQYLAVEFKIARDVVRAAAERAGVHRYLQIRRVFIGCATRRQQAGSADPGRVDDLFRDHPGLGRAGAHNRRAILRKIGVQLARTTLESRWIGARGNHARVGNFRSAC